MFPNTIDWLIKEIQSGRLQWIQKLTIGKYRLIFGVGSLVFLFGLSSLFENLCFISILHLFFVILIFILSLTNYANERIRTHPLRYLVYVGTIFMLMVVLFYILNFFHKCG